MTQDEPSLFADFRDEIAALPADDPLRAEFEARRLASAESLNRIDAENRALKTALEENADLDLGLEALLAIPETGTVSIGRGRWAATLATLAVAAASTAIWFSIPPSPPRASPIVAIMVSATEPQLMAIKFWHDTCPACKEIGPRYERVQQSFSDDPVLFVTFDMSSDESRRQSELLATALGIHDQYKTHFGETGFVMLLDHANQSVMGRLTTAENEAGMRTLLSDALQRTNNQG